MHRLRGTRVGAFPAACNVGIGAANDQVIPETTEAHIVSRSSENNIHGSPTADTIVARASVD
jgi:hypothetical protein